MTLLLSCLFIASCLPYLAKIPVMSAMHQAGGYDNHYPREQQARLTGYGARALAAHQNSFESLLLFAIAILSAVVTHHTSKIIASLAILHLVARALYHVFYLTDKATHRSLSWGVSLLSSLIILALSILSP